MKLKREQNFSEQLEVERNILEGTALKEAASFIETLIIRQVNPVVCLRLLSLLSITQDGIPSKQYRFLSKLFAQSFGHEHVITLFNLRKVRLFFDLPSPSPAALLEATPLASSSRKPKFRDVVKKLKLIPKLPEGTVYDVKNPGDAAFVFGGAYVPVICPLLDACCSGGNLNETSKVLSGGLSRVWTRSTGLPQGTFATRVIGIFFLGGVTFAEVSALRFWSRKHSVKVVVLTTSLVNGNSLMKNLMSIK